jgi:hypothetical protein
VVGGTSVTLTYGPTDVVPNIRAGSWILDGTLAPLTFSNAANPAGTLNNVPPPPLRTRNANFYRVTGVEIDEPNKTMRLDLQTPVKQLPATSNTPAVVAGYYGDLYVLKGVSEVFERIPLSVSNVPD